MWRTDQLAVLEKEIGDTQYGSDGGLRRRWGLPYCHLPSMVLLCNDTILGHDIGPTVRTPSVDLLLLTCVINLSCCLSQTVLSYSVVVGTILWIV